MFCIEKMPGVGDFLISENILITKKNRVSPPTFLLFILGNKLRDEIYVEFDWLMCHGIVIFQFLWTENKKWRVNHVPSPLKKLRASAWFERKSFNIYVREKCSKQNICIMHAVLNIVSSRLFLRKVKKTFSEKIYTFLGSCKKPISSHNFTDKTNLMILFHLQWLGAQLHIPFFRISE